MSIKRKEDRVRNRAIIKTLGLMLLLSLLVIVLVLAGCGEKEKATPTPAPAPTPSPTTARVEFVIDVFQSSNKIASLSSSDLQSLPQKSVETTAGVQEGPTLGAVLEQAGVPEFSKVAIFGLTKERTNAEILTLSREKVNEQVVLDLAGQSKAKLASPDIPYEKWVYDVNRLTVE
jgi:hypothetical protein